MHGPLAKMTADATSPVSYQLPVGTDALSLRDRLGQTLTMRFGGEIRCANCDRVTKKSFNQGFCFPCARRLAACDICILRPERCHYHEGTCREPEWGDANCMQPHYVYLANTSGLKVGITRHNQVPTRWIDQGAVAALPILRVATRQVSGLAEVAIANHVSDKTDWRAMLRGSPEDIDLPAERDRLLKECEQDLAGLCDRFGDDAIEVLSDEEIRRFEYPVLDYPEKVRSLNFDKAEEVGGTLVGIKGQYLIFDHAVINIRRFTSYVIDVVD